MGLRDLCNAIHESYRANNLLQAIHDMYLTLPEPAMRPADAYKALVQGRVERVDIEEAIGRIAASMVAPTPPGIPVIMPGERFIPGDIHCSVDLLDISEYCLQVAQKEYDNLKHFSTDKIYLSATENIQKSVHGSRNYDIIWAIHSLYTINKNKMGKVFTHCLDLLKSNGKFLIYQLDRDSWYYKLYDFYVSHYHQPNTTTKILTSEDQKQILDVLGISYKTIKFYFNHRISATKKQTLNSDSAVSEFVTVLNLLQRWDFHPLHPRY